MAIRFSPSSLRGALAPWQSVFLLKWITDSFAPSAQNDKPFCHYEHRKMCDQLLSLSLRCGCPVDTSAKQMHRPSRQARCVNGYGNSFLPLAIARGFSPVAIRFSFKGDYGFFRAYHSCGAQKLFAWSANNFRPRRPPLLALSCTAAKATSLRMTSFLSLRCGCPVDTSVKQKHRPSRQARPP